MILRIEIMNFPIAIRSTLFTTLIAFLFCLGGCDTTSGSKGGPRTVVEQINNAVQWNGRADTRRLESDDTRIRKDFADIQYPRNISNREILDLLNSVQAPEGTKISVVFDITDFGYVTALSVKSNTLTDEFLSSFETLLERLHFSPYTYENIGCTYRVSCTVVF